MTEQLPRLQELKGHFKIQTFDKFGTMLTEYEDPNLIMEGAREVMAGNISNLSTRKYVDKIVLGTNGHRGTDILIPKDVSDGLTSSRNRLFSETETLLDDETRTILEGDILLYSGTQATNGTPGIYYEYTGATLTAVLTSAVDFGTDWVDLGNTAPFKYNITFTPPGVLVGDAVVVEDDLNSGSTVNFNQAGREITYTIDLDNTAGNGGSAVTYTEASLYAGDTIFSMKTFRGKIKDSSVLVRIIWKISF